jgi:hypothetical protein
MAPKEDTKNASNPADEKKVHDTQAPEGQTDESGNDEGAKPSMWGSFKIETGIVPERAVDSKYDWASFPAPTNPDDPQTWPSVFIPAIGSKTIYNSINKYRDKVQKEGKKAPEFTVSVSKDPKGVRVIRKS